MSIFVCKYLFLKCVCAAFLRHGTVDKYRYKLYYNIISCHFILLGVNNLDEQQFSQNAYPLSDNPGICPFCVSNMTADSVDPETVKKAQNGDKDAFSKLFWQTYRYVLGISRKYLRRDEDVYDAVQETYTNIYANLGKLKVPEAFVTWTGKIAVTCARAMAEKISATGADPLEDEELVEIDDTADNYSAEVKADVTAVLSQMDPADVELLTFIYYDRLRVTEIAKMQGVPATTVYSRLNAAKRKLKELLKIRGIERAVYGGDIITLITTALRNAIGTNLLSMAVAAEILHSVLGQKTKGAVVVAAVARKQRNAAALKIASLLIAAAMLVFVVITLLMYWLSAPKSHNNNTSNNLVVLQSEEHSTVADLNSSYDSNSNASPQSSTTQASSDDHSQPDRSDGSSTNSLSQNTTSGSHTSSTSSSNTNSEDTSGNIGDTENPDSENSKMSSTASGNTSSRKPSSTVSTTAPSSKPSTSSSTPDTQTFSVREVSGGVEITGIMTENTSGVYDIPSTIGGKTVIGIGNSAFYYESVLKSVTLPETLQYIGEQAFANCKNITSIVIPLSVTEIRTNAFTECRKLSEVYIKSNNITVASHAFSTMYQRDVDLTIYAPANSNISALAQFNWDADYVEWNG